MNSRSEPTTVTREELYSEVWSTPVQRLASRYGLSDRGLAKICDKHRIPLPGRGYWAKRAAGYRVSRKALPLLAPAFGHLASVVLGSQKPADVQSHFPA